LIFFSSKFLRFSFHSTLMFAIGSNSTSTFGWITPISWLPDTVTLFTTVAPLCAS